MKRRQILTAVVPGAAQGGSCHAIREVGMNIFEHNRHREALVRRRIKFVVEKGAMARLFKGGTHTALQDQLFRRVAPAILSALRTRDEYDAWLVETVELDCWQA